VEDLQVRSAALIPLVVGACLLGCGGRGTVPPAKYQLEGSLSVVMDLGWDECILDTTDDEIAIRFVRKRGTTMDTPLKIVWAQAGQVLNTPATLDLAEPRPDDPNRQRGIVTRNVLDDKRTTFPLMVRGKLTFFDKIRPDSSVKGQFNVTFENGIEFANGRTIYGPFTAKVPP
jgi:hypothetical protein